MSEEITQGLPTGSFEERVLSELSGIRQELRQQGTRLISVEERLTSVEGRLTSLEDRSASLEEKVDARLRETRPIWEGVLERLTAIESELPRLGGIEKEMARMNRQFRSFVADIFQLRARRTVGRGKRQAGGLTGSVGRAPR
jgi:chromosome segregation ATPase